MSLLFKNIGYNCFKNVFGYFLFIILISIFKNMYTKILKITLYKNYLIL